MSKIIFLLKKNTPYFVKRSLFKIKNYGKRFYCNICNSHLNKFKPGGLDEEVIKNLEIIGGGYHKNDYCPVCKGSYRQRLQFLYLKELDIRKGLKMLHIAPEECYYHLFSKKLGKDYICADLEPERYYYYANPIKMDLIDIPFPENSFDIIICNHVLEHVPDDVRAMQEIFRVLKLQGKAFLQVPISEKLSKTYENSSVVSPEDKLKHFGQKDHVRLYAIDYIKRLESVGFKVEIKQANDYESHKFLKKMALDQKEKLFIACKD